MDCIFVSRPVECRGTCLESRKLKCLFDKQHLVVRQETKSELVRLLLDNIDNPDRYKTVSGQAGRPTGAE